MSPSSPESGDRLEHLDAGVVDEQVADHQDPVRRRRRGDGALGVLDRVGQRLLDQAVLAGAQDALGQRAVARDGRGEHDRVEVGIVEQVVEVGGEAGGREGRCPARAGGFGRVAAPRELAARDGGEVARQVGTPVAEADDADPDHGFQVNSALRARVIRLHGSHPRHRPSLPARRLVRGLPVRRRTAPAALDRRTELPLDRLVHGLARARSVTGPGATGSSSSSIAAIGCTTRTVEAMNASSAACRSSSVHDLLEGVGLRRSRARG